MTAPDPITALVTEYQALVKQLGEIIHAWPHPTEAERKAAAEKNEDGEQ